MISSGGSLAWYLYKNFFDICPTGDFISNSNIISLYDNLMLAVQIWKRVKNIYLKFLSNQLKDNLVGGPNNLITPKVCFPAKAYLLYKFCISI